MPWCLATRRRWRFAASPAVVDRIDAGDPDIPGYTRRMLADADRELLLNRGVGSALVDFLEMWQDLVDVEPPGVLPFADGQATATCDPSDHSKSIIALSLADDPPIGTSSRRRSWGSIPHLAFSPRFKEFACLCSYRNCAT